MTADSSAFDSPAFDSPAFGGSAVDRLSGDDLAHLRRSPLGHLAERLVAASVTGPGGVRLREVPYLAQVNLRLDPSGPAAARTGKLLGTPLPTRPGSAAEAGALRVLWLGPDEWLVVGADGAAPRIERELRRALGDDPGSVVDLSANRTTLELSGPSARQVLEQGCSLDLHPRAFGPGCCAQTTVSKVQVVLDQLDAEPCYRLFVRGSFAQYLADWLLDAMQDRVGVCSHP